MTNDRIIEIIAEYPSNSSPPTGCIVRLAFVGFLQQAAYRQGLSQEGMIRAIALQLPLKQTPLADREQVSFRDWRGGLMYPSWPPAIKYYARWRE